jgi:hypothetical protein
MYIRAGQRIGVASQTRLDRLFRSQREKGNDTSFPAMRRYMVPPWPVTALTAGILRSLLPARDTPKVRILVKLEPDVRVARLAHHASHVFLRAGFALAKRDEKKQQQ